MEFCQSEKVGTLYIVFLLYSNIMDGSLKATSTVFFLHLLIPFHTEQYVIVCCLLSDIFACSLIYFAFGPTFAWCE